MMLPVSHGASRRGIALLWAMVILVVLGVASATAIWEFTAARRALDRRHDVLQATWLLRSGAELAAAKWATAGDAYKGETLELLPDTVLHIAIDTEPSGARIHCHVQVPATGSTVIIRDSTWIVRRDAGSQQIRLELASEAD